MRAVAADYFQAMPCIVCKAYYAKLALLALLVLPAKLTYLLVAVQSCMLVRSAAGIIPTGILWRAIYGLRLHAIGSKGNMQ